jgi:hypothetical protein
MKKIIAFVLIFGFSTSSCEPDDICDPNTPTTPRMKIEFYDFSNPTVKKNVTNLKIIGVGKIEAVVLNPGGNAESQYLSNSNTILLPLNTEADVAKFKFILNSGNKNPLLVNEDLIEFNYSRESFYVSRACGFKTNFTLNLSTPYIHTDTSPIDGKWIQFITVTKSNIANENEVIIKMYF